ncbi:glycosyltransferase family 4 protein [Corallincola spongiicola]|nr:glycosyltransferase family 4 protein [Corallincola spongiicola]
MSKVFRLNIVSTKVKTGRGGISTALIGYMESKWLAEIKARHLVSHDCESKLIIFVKAIFSIFSDKEDNSVYWFHCAQWLSIFRKFILAVFAKLRNHKVYFHFHSYNTVDYIECPVRSRLLSGVLRLSDGVIVLTPWWEKLFLDRYSFLRGKIFVSPNPIDQILERAAKERKVLDTKRDNRVIRILAMSRLVDNKGFEVVIQALCHLPHCFKLTIAGDGPCMTRLKELVSRNGLHDRVEFLGWVNYSEKQTLLRSSDIFCLPSKYDSFGMGFIEAMSYSLPVVALAHQSTPDVVPNGVAGILVNEGTPEVLARAIVSSYERRSEFGKAGREYVLDKFNPDDVTYRVLNFLKREII